MELQNAEEIVADLDEIALAKPRRLNEKPYAIILANLREGRKHATMPKSSMKRLLLASRSSSSPDSWPALSSPDACARPPIRRRQPLSRQAASARQTGRRGRGPRGATAGVPDFTRIAGQAVKGVANISSLQVVQRCRTRRSQRSVLQLLLRRSGCLRSRATRRSLSLGSGVIDLAPTATSSPITTSSARTCARSRSRSPTSAKLRGTVVGTDPATDIALVKIATTALPAAAVGRLDASSRSASGCSPSAARSS